MRNLVQRIKWPLSGLPNMEMYMYGDASVEANKEMQEPLEKLYKYENQPDMREAIRDILINFVQKLKDVKLKSLTQKMLAMKPA